VADTQGLLGNYKDSVRLYQAAVDLTGLTQLAEAGKTDLSAQLDKASKLAARGDYKNAYQTYSSALHDISGLYKMMNVVVESGDYLTMLARRYNTTVSAILAANGISRASEVKASMTLKIPTLP
jgi:LysM repeat protein